MQTLRHALEAVVQHDPAWQKANIPDAWLQNYGPWTQAERLIRESGPRASAEARRLLSRAVQDSFALLDALDADAAAQLRGLAAVEVLRTVWTQQYQRSYLSPLPNTLETKAGVQTKADVEVRSSIQTRPAPAFDDGQRGRVIVTPHDSIIHDPQARRATKQGYAWSGYKLHLTETATEDAPLLIFNL